MEERRQRDQSGSLVEEKHGDDFFYQENKNADNAQDDGDPTHGDDGLG